MNVNDNVGSLLQKKTHGLRKQTTSERHQLRKHMDSETHQRRTGV